MSSTIRIAADSAVVNIDSAYVPLTDLLAFEAPGNWAMVARTYYGASRVPNASALFAFVGNALTFAARGDDAGAMASLWQALVTIKDKAIDQEGYAALTAMVAPPAPAVEVEDDADDQDDDDESGCEGHESLAGNHMGETVFCDGTCKS